MLKSKTTARLHAAENDKKGWSLSLAHKQTSSWRGAEQGCKQTTHTAHGTPHSSYFLSKTQSKVITGSEAGKGGVDELCKEKGGETSSSRRR